jgi:hypothetical protein
MTFGGRLMLKSLIDTDILSEYLRGKNANVALRAEAYLNPSQVDASDGQRGPLPANG